MCDHDYYLLNNSYTIMGDKYFKLKQWLAASDTLHIWLTYLLSNVVACFFRMIGAADPLMYVILAPVCAWMLGVGIECLDGYYGTKQLDKTGILGDIFSVKDVIRDAIGAVMAMITLGFLML